jgi:hypothetical protein
MNRESDIKKIYEARFEIIDKLLNITELTEKNADNFETNIAKAFNELMVILGAAFHKLDDVVSVLEKNNIDTTGIFNR